MGGTASKDDVVIPHVPDALTLKLVGPHHPGKVIFKNAKQLGKHQASVLSLAKTPGWALVPKSAPQVVSHEGVDYDLLQVGFAEAPEENAVEACMDKEGFVTVEDGWCLDVAFANLEQGTPVNLIKDPKKHPSEHLYGRRFCVNADGSVSPLTAPHLFLGSLSRITLVKEDDPAALVLANAEALSGGKAVPLTLSSHKGFGLVAPGEPKRIKQWCLSYVRLDLGEPAKALSAQLVDGFIVSVDDVSKKFVLDVPFDKREVGTNGAAISIISLDNGTSQDPKAKGRAFTVTQKGHVACRDSPELVLGYRGLPVG